MRDADEIIHMVTGTDFIGIVPDSVFPRYCHGLFPKEDRIIDFMNLGSDKEIVPSIVKKAYWFPLNRIEIVQLELILKPESRLLSSVSHPRGKEI